MYTEKKQNLRNLSSLAVPISVGFKSIVSSFETDSKDTTRQHATYCKQLRQKAYEVKALKSLYLSKQALDIQSINLSQNVCLQNFHAT